MEVTATEGLTVLLVIFFALSLAINRRNSLRDEGGIIYSSQNQVEGTCACSIPIEPGSVRCSRCWGFSSTTTAIRTLH